MRTVRWRFKPGMVNCSGSTVTLGEAVDAAGAGITAATLAAVPVFAVPHAATDKANTTAPTNVIKD